MYIEGYVKKTFRTQELRKFCLGTIIQREHNLKSVLWYQMSQLVKKIIWLQFISFDNFLPLPSDLQYCTMTLPVLLIAFNILICRVESDGLHSRLASFLQMLEGSWVPDNTTLMGEDAETITHTIVNILIRQKKLKLGKASQSYNIVLNGVFQLQVTNVDRCS